MQGLEESVSRVATGDQDQYLTFKLGEEEFGIEILRVQEIKGWTSPTPIPNAPPWFKGVMNLRGTVVPVVDLRALFAMPSVECTRFTVVIVVNVGTRVAGLVVDAVSDVLDVPARDVVPAPDMGRAVDTRYLTGIAKSNERLVSLLAMDHVLGSQEFDEALAA